MTEKKFDKSGAVASDNNSIRPTSKTVRTKFSPPGGRSKVRKEQRRSVETRIAILESALEEFAEKGFEGASTRSIGERAGLHFTLITYHFGNKDQLWRAVAEHYFGEITELWNQTAPSSDGLAAIDQIRNEFRALLYFELDHPAFHSFMVRESREASPHFEWLMETYISPVMHRLVPQIERAQKDGELPPGNPVLIHYMVIGIISIFGALGEEIRYNSGLDTSDPEVVNSYWTLIEQIVFKRRLFGVSGT